MESKFTKLEDVSLNSRFSDELPFSAEPRHHLPVAVNRRKCFMNPWMLSTAVLACTTTALFIQSLGADRHCPSFNVTTDFCKLDLPSYLLSLAEDLIATVGTSRTQVQFSGALTWNESGTLVNEHRPGEDIWVGPPSPEIDHLWDSLEEGMSFRSQYHCLILS